MTWGEFKKVMEFRGVKDEYTIEYMDILDAPIDASDIQIFYMDGVIKVTCYKQR